MGGDHAPRAVVEGALAAVREDGARVALVGDRKRIEAEVEALGGRLEEIEILVADEVVTMAESPAQALRTKRRSSIRVCGEAVRDGKADAFVTAGNTGAAMIVAKMIVGAEQGVDRPALAAVFPNPQGRTVILDVGANVDTKPEQLREFAVMGHSYARGVLGVESPRIGLLSIGSEEGKGDELTREGFEALESTGLNFVGNVEGSDVFSGGVDVIVCDGFVGNAILKSAESLVEFIVATMRDEFGASPRTRLGFALSKPAFHALQRRTDYAEYGAAPLLGVRGGCFIAHGRSSPRAIRSSIRRAVEFCTADVAGKIREIVAELHEQERRLLPQDPPADAEGEGNPTT